MLELRCRSQRITHRVQFPQNDSRVTSNGQFTGAQWTPCQTSDVLLMAITQYRRLSGLSGVNANAVITCGDGQFEYFRMPAHMPNGTVLIITEYSAERENWNDIPSTRALNDWTFLPCLRILFDQINILIIWPNESIQLFRSLEYITCRSHNQLTGWIGRSTLFGISQRFAKTIFEIYSSQSFCERLIHRRHQDFSIMTKRRCSCRQMTRTKSSFTFNCYRWICWHLWTVSDWLSSQISYEMIGSR